MIEGKGGLQRWVPGCDGEAEIGVGGVEAGELVEAVVGEEDGADELVGHQAAQYLDPHGRPPRRSIHDADRKGKGKGRGGGGGGGDASLERKAEAVRAFEKDRRVGEGDLIISLCN